MTSASVPPPMQFTARPIVDPEINYYDVAGNKKAKREFYLEQLIRTQEIGVLRDKVRWCYRREGVNHQQNCRHLYQQYIEMIKGRTHWFDVYKPNYPELEEKEPASNH